MTDEEYYDGYLGGDDRCLEALIDRYGDALTLYINGYLHDIQESESLMMDVFVYIFIRKPKLKKTNGLKPYLYKAARHMAFRHKRRFARVDFSLEEIENMPIPVQELPDEIVIDAERRRALHCCMSKLKTEYREVLYLIYFDGLSYADVAVVMGKNEKQITNLAYRGKQSLKKLLEKEGITYAE